MGECGGRVPGSPAGRRPQRVTHREDAHADWGLQQARHLEPSHPAAAGAGAGAGTFDSQLLGQRQEPLQKVRQVDETSHSLDAAQVWEGPAEGQAKGTRFKNLLTNRPLGNGSYCQPGSEVGAGSGFRMRKDPPAPPAARGGWSLGGGVSLWRCELSRLINCSLCVHLFIFRKTSMWSHLHSLKFTFTITVSPFAPNS